MSAIERIREAVDEVAGHQAHATDDLQIWYRQSTVMEQEAAARGRLQRRSPRPATNERSIPIMRLEAATATNPTETGLDLTFRFRELTPEQSAAGAELVREVHAAAADGRISHEEATAILVDVVALMSPVLAERIDPLQTTLARALRDGKINVREGLMIGFGFAEAFGF